MALIGKIRRNSWILIVMLGLGLGGFIIMDMTSSSRMGGGAQFTVGEVNGESIDWNDFQRAEQILYQNSDVDVYSRRDYLWNYFIEKTILQEEATLNGISVGAEEMEELQFGVNLSPVVQRNFIDPSTNQVNRQNLNSFKQALETGQMAPEYQNFWGFQKEEIEKDRIQTKINMMVQKAMYTPTWMAEEYQKNTSTSLDFAYVKIPFEESGEEDLSLSEEDYVNYIQENKAQFETDEESRNAKFVVFNVSPTAQDSADLENLIAELVEPFREAENDSLFVDSNYGSMDVAYFKADAVSPVIADTVFNMEIGEVHGPYIDGNAYKAVKLVDKKIIPDSVDSRHILFRVETAEQFAPAQQRMDSVKALIESGAEQFDSLAMKVSQDPGSGVQGGNLGYAAPGRMVKPFNDMLFYQAEEGELNIVYTQFGIHLIEVLDKKYINNEEGVKLAFIEETIVPSEETQNRIYDDVLEFVASNRDLETLTSTIDQDDDLILEDANMLTKNGYSLANLGGGNSSRDIVRWIFDPGSKVGRVSPEVYIYEDPVDYYNAKYVVAALDKIVPAGLPDVNDVKSQIEDAVRNRKAGETIAANIESKDLNTLAAEYEVEIDTIENVNFGSSFLQGIGAEPKVIATADIIPPEQVSKPIIGTSGVYVIQLLDRSENTPSTDIGRLRQQASMTIHSAVQFELIEAMKNASKIDDSRYNFY